MATSPAAPPTQARLHAFPVGAWREARRRNFNSLRAVLLDLGPARLREPSALYACPFSVILVCDVRYDPCDMDLVARAVSDTLL